MSDPRSDLERMRQELEARGVRVGDWGSAGGTLDPAAAARQSLERLRAMLVAQADTVAADLAEARARAAVRDAKGGS